MCREYKYQANCWKKHILSEYSQRFEPCRDYASYLRGGIDDDPRGKGPNDPKSCIYRDSGKPIINDSAANLECWRCLRVIMPAEFNPAKEITAAINQEHLNNIKKGKQKDEVPVPEATRAQLRRLAGGGLGGPTQGRTRSNRSTPSGELSEFTSWPPSSEQEPDTVYNQHANAHRRGVSGTDSVQEARLQDTKNARAMLNDVNMTEDMRQEFEPAIESKERMAKWTEEVRKRRRRP